MAFDFKKEYKEFYMPKNKPSIVTVPPMNYIAVRGKGDPNAEVGDKAKTGQQIRLLMGVARAPRPQAPRAPRTEMEKRGVTVRDVKNALSLACVQSVYHWLDGQSMPTLDNLYALSDLLEVPMDMLVCGNRRYDPEKDIPEGAERLFRYYRLIQDCMAA